MQFFTVLGLCPPSLFLTTSVAIALTKPWQGGTSAPSVVVDGDPVPLEGDGDDGGYLEVVVRQHRSQPAVSAASRNRVLHGGVSDPSNNAGRVSGELSQEEFAQQHEIAPQRLRIEVPLSRSFSMRQPTGSPPRSGPHPESLYSKRLELIIGVLLGILVTLLSLIAYQHLARSRPPKSTLPTALVETLDGGRLNLIPFKFQDADFTQLSWTLDAGGSSRDRDCVTTVVNQSGMQVARGVGRLLSTPNGEVHLSTVEPHALGEEWCILKRPAPSRRPGQLWDFKVCYADGTPYMEVRQRSETKCLVNHAVSKRVVMTVIGNFTYPVFLSGERSIHVWTTQDNGQPCMVAQCEARIEGTHPIGVADDAENMSLAPTPTRRFLAISTADTDASLVLAVLLGLQDVHQAARHSAHSREASSASTGSGWPGGGGKRMSSGSSTAETPAQMAKATAMQVGPHEAVHEPEPSEPEAEV